MSAPRVDEPEQIRASRLQIPEYELDRLRARLRDTRWPDQETTTGWGQGVPLAELQRLCRYWVEGYDWRRLERSLNTYQQFRTTLDGVDVHFIHARSRRPGARPLLMLHGWPGSGLDYLDVIPYLTGGVDSDPSGTFDLIIPSLPGFGLSDHPSELGWGVDRIASAMTELMRRLGYDSYLVQGGDWGSVVATAMAEAPGANCAAIHLTTLTLQPPPTTSPEARAEVERIAQRRSEREQFGYAIVQSTRPQTIAYALADSPVGQAAWIYDKLACWTEHDSDISAAISDDQALDLITLYWLTNSAGSTARLYAESLHQADNSRRLNVPVAVSCFPADITGEPKEYAEHWFPRLCYWGTPARGGHFPALEQPAIFSAEVRLAFQDTTLGRTLP